MPGPIRFCTSLKSTREVSDPTTGKKPGAVGSPLSVMHQQGMTVLDMVLLAGGLTEFASGNNAKLYRKYGDKVEVFPIYLSDMLEKGRLDTNYELHPADIITVPERIF